MLPQRITYCKVYLPRIDYCVPNKYSPSTLFIFSLLTNNYALRISHQHYEFTWRFDLCFNRTTRNIIFSNYSTESSFVHHWASHLRCLNRIPGSCHGCTGNGQAPVKITFWLWVLRGLLFPPPLFLSVSAGERCLSLIKHQHNRPDLASAPPTTARPTRLFLKPFLELVVSATMVSTFVYETWGSRFATWKCKSDCSTYCSPSSHIPIVSCPLPPVVSSFIPRVCFLYVALFHLN